MCAFVGYWRTSGGTQMQSIHRHERRRIPATTGMREWRALAPARREGWKNLVGARESWGMQQGDGRRGLRILPTTYTGSDVIYWYRERESGVHSLPSLPLLLPRRGCAPHRGSITRQSGRDLSKWAPAPFFCCCRLRPVERKEKLKER